MKIKRVGFLSSLLILMSIFLPVAPVHGIYGGTSATGNPIVVGLLGDKDGTRAGCSGALVDPRIVMTAAHCLTMPPQSLWIPEPGTDLRDTTTRRIQADRYFIPSDFSASKFPYQNDFGIVILKSPFPNVTPLEVATYDQVKKWMNEEREVFHIGYGCTELVDAPPCKVTSPIPHKLITQMSKLVPNQFDALSSGTFSVTKISVERTVCGGDSGSPLITESSGKFIYVGAQSSSNGAGCTKTCNIVCVATQGLPSANIQLVAEAQEYVSVSDMELKAKQKAEAKEAGVKKTTITCVKGKLIKKVTAIKPKCPTGYRLKK